jgi:hypothetical protein
VADAEIIAAFDACFDRLTVDREAAAATALFTGDDDILAVPDDLTPSPTSVGAVLA